MSCLGLVFAASGCRTWSGGQVYTPKWKPAWKKAELEAKYRVGLPGEGWRVHREEGSQVAWYSDDHKAIVQVRSQCQEHGDSDLQSFTDHLRIDTTEWKVIEERFVRLEDRDALRSTVRAELDGGGPVSMELIVLKKDGCLFDLSLISLPSGYEGALPAFERVVAGFEFPIGRQARQGDA